MDYGQFSLGSWGPYLKKFIEGPQCDGIYQYLKERSAQGRVILPSWENTFRAFRETPFDDLKCIFFLQDPYPWRKNGKDVADGIAMSCSNTQIIQPSLSLFYDGMGATDRNPDLAYLCHRGIMMLNTSLTVEMDRPNSHSMVRVLDKKTRLWEPFMKYLLEEVLSVTNGKILVFCGRESQYYERFVNPLQHYIFKIEHPAAAAHAERSWNHEQVFSKIDYLLKQNNNTEVQWTSKIR